ncbi:ubiquitin-activating enzyme E1 1 [Rhizoctonia solani AG-1 IA]|uniref:Ubiquitin-activating enzyme E1 1 n=1 Tax=Thanatephorus cucumeris (strain AG1-IA) TaxID=983506 RepID=L8X5F3_THACA|nr:ubiquitin-activating enzyme E1 1 [Rhizoctonia solani AG-1 IA]
MSAIEIDEAQIDEGLYSRQLYVLAMKRMAASNVLIVGVKGLGVEIGKANIVLAGVKSVTLFDPEPVQVQDLGTQVRGFNDLIFFLRESDVGKPRAAATLPRLAELNAYVPVKDLGGSPGQEITVDLIKGFQVCDGSSSGCMRIFNLGEGCVGGHFDRCSNAVNRSTQDKDGIVTCLDETRHGLEDGNFVTFSEVKGLEELNDCEPLKVTVKGPYTFSIGDTSNLKGDYVSGGIFTQVKMPKIIEFVSCSESLKSPEFFITDFAKFDRPATLHAGFQALSAFKEKHGHLPKPRNPADAEAVLALAKEIAGSDAEDLNTKVIQELAYQATGDISPVNAVIGGFIAQEALKSVSAKFHPMIQHLYFDSLESLPAATPSEQDAAPQQSRYDGQIAVFGSSFQKKIADHRQFLVGSGAIGCEMLKNWSLMGLASGPKGIIHVTDLDTIEKSNLNRQFLFRAKDLGKFKSEQAAAAVIDMNPDLTDKIVSHQDAVGPDTESLYMDQRCVFFQKPLLESGTLGTKGNTQVVVPHLTESYSSSQDPPEKETPSCTVKNFPNQIHTLKYGGQSSEQIKQIHDYLVANKPLTFEECIVWARLQFEDNYVNAIKQLLYSLPKDAVTSTGQPFWSGPKRAPDPLTFDSDNATHLDYIIAAANLHAYNYGLKGSNDPALFKRVADGVKVPEFVPRSGVKIQINETDAPQEGTGKDDDTNHHIDFITSASNLRALNYSIQTASRHQTKQIAGKIIPAINSTRYDFEPTRKLGQANNSRPQIIDKKEKLEDYKNGFVNLALPFFGFSEPIYGETTWTLWDRFEFKNNPTLKELVSWFETNHKLDISMVSQGVSMLWSSFTPPKKSQERLPMKINELVEHVSKKPIPPWTKNLILEVIAADEEGEDVEVRSIVPLHIGPPDADGLFLPRSRSLSSRSKSIAVEYKACIPPYYHMYQSSTSSNELQINLAVDTRMEEES